MPNIFQPQPLNASDLAPLNRAAPEINFDPQQTDRAFASAKAIGDSMGQAFTPLLPQNRLAEELKTNTNILHQNSLKRMPAGTDLLGVQTVQNYAGMFGAPLYGPDGMYDVSGMEKKLSEVATQSMEAQNAVMRARANPMKLDARTEQAMTRALESVGISVPPTASSMDKWNAMQDNPAATDIYHQLLDNVGAKSVATSGGSPGTATGTGTNRAAAAMITKEAPMVNMATAANETENLDTASVIFAQVGDSILKSHPNFAGMFNAVPGVRAEDHKIQLGYLATKANLVPEGPQKDAALKALGVWATAKNVLRVDMPNMMNPGKSATDEDMKAYDRDYFNLNFDLTNLGKTTDISFKQQVASTMDLITTRTGAYSLLIPKAEQQVLDLGGYYFGANNKIGRAQLVRYGKEIPAPVEVLSQDGQTDPGALQAWMKQNKGSSVEIVPLSAQQLQEYNAASKQPGFVPAQQVPSVVMSGSRNAEDVLDAIRSYRQTPDSQKTSFNRIATSLKLLQGPDVLSLVSGNAQPPGSSDNGAPKAGETWNWKDAKGVETPYTMQSDGSWQPAAAVSVPAPKAMQNKVGQLLNPTPATVVPLPVPTSPSKPLTSPVAITNATTTAAAPETPARKLSNQLLGFTNGPGQTSDFAGKVFNDPNSQITQFVNGRPKMMFGGFKGPLASTRLVGK